MSRYHALVPAVCIALFSSSVHAQNVPEWLEQTTLSGLAFGDVYAMAANHDTTFEGANGLWARRVYFTADHRLGDALDFRLRFEMNSPGDFTSAANLEPFVKDLWVRWSIGAHRLSLGIAPTPTWDATIEKTWGYRDVEKTPLDLQKFGPSRDFGVLAQGRLDRRGKVRYHAMVANGAGTKAETNEGKKAYLALDFYPLTGLLIEVYGDYEDRPGDTDRATVQGFAAYRGQWGRVGIQWARQHRQGGGTGDLDLDLGSAFVVIRASDRVAFLGRFDRMFDPNPDAGKIDYLPMVATVRSNLVLAGIDIALHQRFHLIPNLEAVVYDSDVGPAPDADVMLRVTYSITF